MTVKEKRKLLDSLTRVRRGGRKNLTWNYKKNKLVKDKTFFGLGYKCECGKCRMFGDFDLWLYKGVPMRLECLIKIIEKSYD